MAVGTPTTNQGNGSPTPSVAVPAGVAAGDIVVLIVTGDTQVPVYTGHWPTGFTQLLDADCAADGQAYGIAWKRLTGADSGTYTLGNIGNAPPYLAVAIPLTGRHATNPPVLSSNSIQSTLQSSPMTITANGVTAVAGDDVLFISLPDVNTSGGGNGHSSWASGFSEILDIENTLGGGADWGNVGVAKSENVGAGATGTKTTTFTTSAGTSGWGAWLIRVPAAAGGSDQNVTSTGGIASTETFGSSEVDLGLVGTGIASAQAFGSGQVNLSLSGTGIGSVETFGSSRTDLAVLGTGIGSAEAFGSAPQVNETILGSGIPSAEAFGGGTVTGGAVGTTDVPARSMRGWGQ